MKSSWKTWDKVWKFPAGCGILSIYSEQKGVSAVKILVLSDSHSSLSFMRLCVDKVRPDMILHLGDHYDDGETLRQEYPGIRLHQVPGNCDLYRSPAWAAEAVLLPADGVKLFMTHGHRHGVKRDIYRLLLDARKHGADAALYGHTHVADCHQETDGLWVLNPGCCGYYGGSAGLIETERGKIKTCRILRQDDLEVFT